MSYLFHSVSLLRTDILHDSRFNNFEMGKSHAIGRGINPVEKGIPMCERHSENAATLSPSGISCKITDYILNHINILII